MHIMSVASFSFRKYDASSYYIGYSHAPEMLLYSPSKLDITKSHFFVYQSH